MPQPLPLPQRRTSKHARSDSGALERSNSFKIPRPASRPPANTAFDKASFEPVRGPVRKVLDSSHRRFSMLDLPTQFDAQEPPASDSPGNALGALKQVVAGRQLRADRASQSSLAAHNQRWAKQATPALSLAHDSDTTPSTDRSSRSAESTRCVCHGPDDGSPMAQCEACGMWLHMSCVGLRPREMPKVWVCVFCTGQMPKRGGRSMGTRGMGGAESPLGRKGWR